MDFYLQLGFLVFLTPCLHCPWLSRNSYKQEIKTETNKQTKKSKNKQTNPKQKILALACLNCEIPSDLCGWGGAVCHMSNACNFLNKQVHFVQVITEPQSS